MTARHRWIVGCLAATTGIAPVAICLAAAPALAGGTKHAICHATSSAKNPYVLVRPATDGVMHGHLGHQGGRDVIPPFTYKGVEYSQNWDAAGEALLAAGCAVPAPPPELSPPPADEPPLAEDPPVVEEPTPEPPPDAPLPDEPAPGTFGF